MPVIVAEMDGTQGEGVVSLKSAPTSIGKGVRRTADRERFGRYGDEQKGAG